MAVYASISLTEEYGIYHNETQLLTVWNNKKKELDKLHQLVTQRKICVGPGVEWAYGEKQLLERKTNDKVLTQIYDLFNDIGLAVITCNGGRPEWYALYLQTGFPHGGKSVGFSCFRHPEAPKDENGTLIETKPIMEKSTAFSECVNQLSNCHESLYMGNGWHLYANEQN